MPREIWATVLGIGLTSNFVCWRRGVRATFCASFLRPLVEAIPFGQWILAGGFWLLYRHIVKHIPKKERARVWSR